MIIAGVGETLYMTLFSTFFGYVFGMPLGILLKVSDKEGLRPNAVLYKILDVMASTQQMNYKYENGVYILY